MVLHNFCGLDFGTSNSTIGIFKNNRISMVPLEQGKPLIRSAVFFDYEQEKCLLGQEGITKFLTGTKGRLMMSLKSILGSTLMHEKTLIENRLVSYTDIIGYLIRHLKVQAEKMLGHEITDVVMGRPVRFHDYDDKKDKSAQITLEEVAKNQGFKNILFQYEPIAAALAYEATITKEQLALIVDLGGGTSDFSIIRLRSNHQHDTLFKKSTSKVKAQPHKNRLEDVLSNKGIHIGGTDFDRLFSLKTIMHELGLGGKMQGISNQIQIPSSYYHDLTTWHTINSLYTYQTRRAVQNIRDFALEKRPIERLIHVIENQQGHNILNEIEQGKCQLSLNPNVNLDFSFIENNFRLSVKRKTFEDIIQSKVEQLIQKLLETVKEAQISSADIESIFFTGGSTQIPLIRKAIENLFPTSKIIQGDVFNSVGKGLAIDAQYRFL